MSTTHTQMDGGIAHDATLADLFAAGFELRLDQDETAIPGAREF